MLLTANRKKAIAAISLVAITALLAGCERPKMGGMPESKGAVPITYSVVEQKDTPADIIASGQSQAFETVQIYSRVNGYLQARNYVEGSFVQKGDLLYTIDPSDYQTAYDQADAAWINAKEKLAQVKPLYEVKAASLQDLDTAVANEKSTKAQFEQAKLNLGYTRITSPVNAYADKHKIDTGTYISAGTNSSNNWLTTVYQTDPMYVYFYFSDDQRLAYQSALASGKLVAPKNSAFDVELTMSDGSKLERNGTIDFQAPSYDQDTGTMTYRAVFKNKDNRLIPFQFVEVRVKGAIWKDAIVAPQTAVQTGPGGKYVFVVEANNTITSRPVKIGPWVTPNVIISDGLKSGEKIALNNFSKLRTGAEVNATLQAVKNDANATK
ncbi:MAG: hypothetical protein RL154_1507 [Pseudomonadota bacterium]